VFVVSQTSDCGLGPPELVDDEELVVVDVDTNELLVGGLVVLELVDVVPPLDDDVVVEGPGERVRM
jgi:hypothetical protein